MENVDWQALGFQFKVWWIPQLGMKGKFERPVFSPKEGKSMMTLLADYDIFQFNNNIKPDYCNVGSIVYCHSYLTGSEWHDYPENQDEESELIAEAQKWLKAHMNGESWAC